MSVNADKTSRWKQDITQSVDFYNKWFMQYAPKAYRDTRVKAIKQVEAAMKLTSNLTDITPTVLRGKPALLGMLRMATAPPIARDRLVGLAEVSQNLVREIEIKGKIPPRMPETLINTELEKISRLIVQMLDKDIFPWFETGEIPDDEEVHRASTIVADRLCGSQSDPIIRNAQERRQFDYVKQWLELRGYSDVSSAKGLKFEKMTPGTFVFRLNIPVKLGIERKQVNVPVDIVIMPKLAKAGELPLLIEAKSAGDFTNPNKRRKEEAMKISQLRKTYGNNIHYVLFLCGYFDSGYLGYEAAEGIDWVWEHRIEDLAQFGV